VLGRSPGQARAHTGEVGVGVGVGRARRRAAGCLCSGFASHCEDGDGLAGLHCFGWAAREWEMAVGSGSASGRVSAHNQC
jgi:hypothetical protein